MLLRLCVLTIRNFEFTGILKSYCWPFYVSLRSRNERTSNIWGKSLYHLNHEQFPSRKRKGTKTKYPCLRRKNEGIGTDDPHITLHNFHLEIQVDQTHRDEPSSRLSLVPLTFHVQNWLSPFNLMSTCTPIHTQVPIVEKEIIPVKPLLTQPWRGRTESTSRKWPAVLRQLT